MDADNAVKAVGEHQDGSPIPKDSDVCAALKVLNRTMEGLAKNMFKVLQTFEQGAEQVGAIAGDLKRATTLVDQVLKTFGQKDGQPSNSLNAASDVIVVDDEDVGGGKNITIPVARGKKEVYIPEKLAGQPAGDTVPSMEPLLHSGILGNWNDDTLILGSIIHQEQTRMFNTSGTGGSSSGATAAAPVHSSYIPLQMRGKVRGGLGENVACSAPSVLGTPKPSKIAKIAQRSPEDMKRSGKMRKPMREPPLKLSCATVGVTFPPFIRSNFKITRAMRYSLEEAQAAAYLFGASLSSNEVLFKRGTHTMDREAFSCLLPGNDPSEFVMELMSYKTAWTQAQLHECTVWSLPVIFSDFILDPEIDDEHVITYYADDYFPKPTALKYIYVQMKDVLKPSKESHYYLMTVDILNGKIWLFDSFPTLETHIGRVHAASEVARALDKVMKVLYPDLNVLGSRPPLAEWHPNFVLGVPNMNNCYYDKMWMLLWLQMEQLFTLNPVGQQKNNIDCISDKIRMDTALALATEHFNEMRDEFLERSLVDWNSRRTAREILP